MRSRSPRRGETRLPTRVGTGTHGHGDRQGHRRAWTHAHTHIFAYAHVGMRVQARVRELTRTREHTHGREHAPRTGTRTQGRPPILEDSSDPVSLGLAPGAGPRAALVPALAPVHRSPEPPPAPALHYPPTRPVHRRRRLPRSQRLPSHRQRQPMGAQPASRLSQSAGGRSGSLARPRLWEGGA